MESYLQEIRRTLVLAFPMILGQLGHMALHLTDTAMVGRVGVPSLAAAAFGGNVTNAFLIVGYGLTMALSVLVARAYGAEDHRKSVRILIHGLLVTGIYALAVALLFALGYDPARGFFLDGLKQPEEIVELARGYVIMVGWSVIPALLWQALRNFAEAQNRPWAPFVILIGGVVLNIFLNWVLIFGNLGAPALGLYGAGIATLIARIVTLVVMVVSIMRLAVFRSEARVAGAFRLSGEIFRRYLAVGIPSAAVLVCEVGLFTVASFFMGALGEIPLAAHQIALQLVAFAFMVPLGVSFAVGIRLGQAAGKGDAIALRRIGFGAFAFTTILMLAFATIYYLLRNVMPGVFLGDVADRDAVLLLSAQLLTVAAVFQLFDGLQVVAIGALRGVTDVRVPTALAVLGYWVVSVPAAWWLAFRGGYDGVGVWLGLLIGLALAAILLGGRFVIITHPHRVHKIMQRDG